MHKSPLPVKHKVRNLLIGFVALLLLLAVAFQVFINRYLERVICERLEKLIVYGSDSLYHFKLDHMAVNFWDNSVTVKNLHIGIDSAHYMVREKLSTLPALTFEINLASGSVRGIGLLPLLYARKISIESIVSKKANLSFSRHFRRSDEKIDTGNVPLWKLIQPEIKSININKILLDDLSINYTNADSATAFKWKFEHCSTIIDNTVVDSVSAGDNDRILFSKNVSIQFTDVKLQTSDGLYAIETKKLWYSSAAKNIEFEDFTLHPVKSKTFYKDVGYDKDRFNLIFPRIRMVDFHLSQWINDNILYIDTVHLVDAQINVYKDRTVKADTRSKLGNYPHQLLHKLPFTINIRQIQIAAARLVYTEKNRESQLEGKLIFHNLNGSIRNVTNDNAFIKKNPNCLVDIKGVVMQNSPLHALFTLHLNDAVRGGFEVKADISKMEAPALNTITVPLSQTAVKSLDISELHFFMKGNERSGTGNLRILYKNLEIDLKKRDDESGKMKNRKLLSFLVNRLVVYRDNPMKGKERRAVDIQTTRNPQKSFFNLIWKTLYNSFKEISIRIDRLKDDKSLKKKNE